MKVKDLIKALKEVDQELPIITYANGHSYHSKWSNHTHGGLVVGIYHRGYDEGEVAPRGIIIGNVTDDRFNYPNDWMGTIIVRERRR